MYFFFLVWFLQWGGVRALVNSSFAVPSSKNVIKCSDHAPLVLATLYLRFYPLVSRIRIKSLVIVHLTKVFSLVLVIKPTSNLLKGGKTLLPSRMKKKVPTI